jgi:hypothetical protein
MVIRSAREGWYAAPRGRGEFGPTTEGMQMEVRGEGRAMFAAILLMIAGVLNVVYGIGAISDAHFYTSGGTHYVFSSLHTWGWIALIVGVIQLTGGFSLMGGGVYGRTIGIVAASLGAINALFSIGGQYPWWSLGIFALCVIVLHGLFVYGEPAAPSSPPRA